MSRARITLAELARSSGVGFERLKAQLDEVGLRWSGSHDRIARADMSRATEIAKALAREPVKAPPLPVPVAAQADVPSAAPVQAAEPHHAPAMTYPKPARNAAKVKASPSATPTVKQSMRAEGIDWRRIGAEESLEHLTASQIEAIHWQVVEDFAEQDDPISGGVRLGGLLASAALRPHTSLGGVTKYPTAAMAGAALFHSIVQNHPFHDGNKRTALISLIAFLETNGWLLQAEEDELYAYVLRVADHRVQDAYDPTDPFGADKEVLAIAEWLHERLRRVEKGEFRIQWRILRRILAENGCEFKKARRGNRMDILRNGRKSQIGYTGDGMDVERNAVHKIRRDLELDESHGVDSQAFYRGDLRIPDFINKYRKILSRLAEYDREQE